MWWDKALMPQWVFFTQIPTEEAALASLAPGLI